MEIVNNKAWARIIYEASKLRRPPPPICERLTPNNNNNKQRNNMTAGLSRFDRWTRLVVRFIVWNASGSTTTTTTTVWRLDALV